jgi:hypothetical protein
LSINLPLHNHEELTTFLGQIYDPASPTYHHYLTPDEFTARFGPTVTDYEAVIAWAARHNLTVTAKHPNRMLLEVQGTVADIESALQVTLRTYAHPTEPRIFFAPDTEPSVETGVPISYLGGLDNFARPRPKSLHRKPLFATARATPKMGSGPNGSLGGPDFRAAYVPGVSVTGAGQQVGLLEFDGYYSGDISSYESQMSLPAVTLQNVLLDGFDGIPTTGTGSGNTEVALDIEMAVSMAPSLSQIVIYEAGPSGFANDILASMVTNKLIKQFSCSWDFGPVTPAQRGAMDGYFQELSAQGQSFFNAAGDNGAVIGGFTPPDDDSYIIQVGGTTLATASPAGAWLSETVWNSGEGPGVSGGAGGVSTTYPIPAWQKGVNMSANNGSTAFRNSPDVAMVADNIFIVADNGQSESVAGTSAAAPLWTAFAALANQWATNAGLSALGFVNPAIYHVGTNSGYLASFDDITVGNNTNINNAAEYQAVPGYDLCSGWGSPVGSSLILALIQTNGFQITPGRGPVANGPVGGPFTVTNQTFFLTNLSKVAVNWALGGVPAWLNVSASNGSLAAGVGGTVAVSLNAAAGLLAAGVYSANLIFTNVGNGQTQCRQFTLQVDQNLVQDGGFEAGDFCYWNLSGTAGVYTNNFVDSGTVTGYSPEAGNFFGVLAEISNLAWLSQPLPTRPGQFYRLSFWLENPDVSTPNQFEVQWNTNASSTNIIFNQTNMGAFGWTNLQFLVQASTNVTTLRFGARNDIYFFALDSVSVTPVQVQTMGAFQVFLNEVLNSDGLAPVAPDVRVRARARGAVTNGTAGLKRFP